MAHLFVLILAIIFAFSEAASGEPAATSTVVGTVAKSGEVKTVITFVTDFVYADKKNNVTDRVVLEKLTEAASDTEASAVNVIKRERKNIDGFFTAVYHVTSPSCHEVSSYAVEAMKDFSPVIFIKYRCGAEADMEFLRNGHLSFNV